MRQNERMNINYLKRKIPNFIVIICAIFVTSLVLIYEGRSFFSSSGKLFFWIGDINSSETSQQLLDPYSFTHVLHGVLFFWLFYAILRRIAASWRFCLAVCLECAWEIIENSQFIIDRYRTATISLGYTGDSIINSLSDITMCSTGFIIAYFLGFKRSLILFACVEIMLILWVRDSLLINIVMLIYPIEAVKLWQAG